MKNIKIYIIFLILGLISEQGFPQSAATDSLEAYLVIAAQNNLEVKAAFSLYLAALEKVPQAGGWYDPQLSMDFFLKPMELVGGNEVLDIRLMQMFPWFGTLKAAKDEASMMAKARYEVFNIAKADLYYNVKSGWYRILKYDQEITLQSENIQFLESIEQMILVRYQNPTGNSGVQKQPGAAGTENNNQNAMNAGQGGMGSTGTQPVNGNNAQPAAPMPASSSEGMGAQQSGLTDVLSIKMEILEQKNQLALLLDQKKNEVAGFNALLNRPLNSAVFITDSLQLNVLSVEQSSMLDNVLSNNPMLKMLDAEGQSYALMEQKVRKMGMPMFGIGVDYVLVQKRVDNTSMMNGNDMAMPMLTLTLPIYRNKYNAMQNEAKFMVQAKQLERESLENMLQVQSGQVIQDLEDAARRIVLYNELVSLSRKTTDILITSYSTGSVGYEEVLRIQYKTLDYGFKYIEAVIDYNTAVAAVEKLMNADRY